MADGLAGWFSPNGKTSSYTQMSAVSAETNGNFGSPSSPQARTIRARGTFGSFLEEGVSRGAPEPIEEGDLVQFTSRIYYCRESDGHVELDLMRIGRCEEQCSVFVQTSDSSAVTERDYTAFSQWVTLQPDEVLKTIKIDIKQDDFFDTTLQFDCAIQEVRGCQHGQIIGCRVLVSDDDVFPSNTFASQIQSGDEDLLSSITVRLLLSYIKLTFLRVPHIMWKSILTVCLDQLHNLYYLLKIYIQVYLVDVLLNADSSPDRLFFNGSRQYTAAFLGALYIVPMFILMMLDRTKEVQLEMSKTIRKHLQVNLFRKYLNYTDESRKRVPMYALTFAMDGDIPMLVEDGYLFMFELLKSLGKVVATSYFMVMHDPSVVLVLMAFPLVLLFFFGMVKTKHVLLENKVIELKALSTGRLQDAVQHFELVQKYDERDVITRKYGELITDSYAAQTNFQVFKFWTDQFVPFLTVVAMGVYIFVGAERVINGYSSPGYCLAFMQIIQELGARFQDIFHNVEKGINAGSPLVELTIMLNLPTDLPDRQRRFMKKRDTMRALVRQRPKVPPANDQRRHVALLNTQEFFDKVKIDITRLSMGFLPALEATTSTEPGSLTFITGAHGCGKSTLLRFIAGTQKAVRGELFLPTHFQVLHVDVRKPLMLVDDTLFENLTFGSRGQTVDRVRRIFKRLRLDRSSMLRREFERNCEELSLEVDGQVADGKPRPSVGRALSREGVTPPPKTKEARATASDWHRVLSDSEAKRLHLARAFISNPQVLVTHRPFDEVDDADVDMYLHTLREFVDRRGLEMGEVELQKYRPRTCFFTGGGYQQRTERNMAHADVVWHLTDRGLKVEAGGWGTMGTGRSRVADLVGNMTARMSSLSISPLSPEVVPGSCPGHDHGHDRSHEDIALLQDHRDADKGTCMRNCVGYR